MSKRKKLYRILGVILMLVIVFIAYRIVIHLPKFDEAFARIETDEKVVALTFDDGPSAPYSTEILQVLKEHETKATFFMIGRNIEENRAVAQAVVDQGHQVGNHTYSHPHMILKSKKFIAQEIEVTDSILFTLGVPEGNDFRPPYGQHLFYVHDYLKTHKRNNVLFDIIVSDWSETDENVIVDRVMSKLKKGSIICLHDGGGNREATVKATKLLIPMIKHMGYKLVTIEELMTYKQS